MSVTIFNLRREWIGLLLAVVGSVLFFTNLHRLWPLANFPLSFDKTKAITVAKKHLKDAGYDISSWKSIAYLSSDRKVTDYLEESFGNTGVQKYIEDGHRIYFMRVLFKKQNDPHQISIELNRDYELLTLFHTYENDDSGEFLASKEARTIAEQAGQNLAPRFPAGWEAKAESSREFPARMDHEFRWERLLSEHPVLRERLSIGIAGDRVARFERSFVVPDAAARAMKAKRAPGEAMQTLGFLLLAASAIAGFWFFLNRLQLGTVRLARSFLIPGIIAVCLIGTYLTQTHYLFGNWEPLWPRWVSNFQYLAEVIGTNSWMLLVLLALVGAADALDREQNLGRGDSLWKFFRGRFTDPQVGTASLRGFMVGIACGVAMLVSMLLLVQIFDARASIQPRGFFYYALNSPLPSVTTLLFFLNVALLEEIGYRFFSGTLLEKLFKKRWIAIWVPAIVYGLTHTMLDFLPPATPWWGRAFLLTMVGAVWGYAFFKYDALTVVLSHWTADLFIFNWPRIGSGDPTSITLAILTILVPVLPGLWLLMRYRNLKPIPAPL